ncbi:MAG: hypothetical protein ACI9JN_001933 [Bacteroidia bacterium]|jgi:hypothetical protein
MRRSLTILLLFTTSLLNADQFKVVRRDVAIKAVALLNDQKCIVEWCACCFTKPKKYQLISAEIEKGHQPFVRINVKVKTKTGTKELKSVDLAYIHIKDGRLSDCVAIALGLPADPCTTPFRWRSVERQ